MPGGSSCDPTEKETAKDTVGSAGTGSSTSAAPLRDPGAFPSAAFSAARAWNWINYDHEGISAAGETGIDEAFTRRLDIIVHFTVPDAEHRALLWRRHLPDSLPMDDDVDVDVLADRVTRAAALIDYCRDRILLARAAVDQATANLAEPD